MIKFNKTHMNEFKKELTDCGNSWAYRDKSVRAQKDQRYQELIKSPEFAYLEYIQKTRVKLKHQNINIEKLTHEAFERFGARVMQQTDYDAVDAFVYLKNEVKRIINTQDVYSKSAVILTISSNLSPD